MKNERNKSVDRIVSRSKIITGFTLMLAISYIVIGCDSIVDQNVDDDVNITTSDISGVLSVEVSPVACIVPDSGIYNVVSATETVEWGNRKNPSTKSVSIEYYNTLTELVLRVKSSHKFADVLMDDESIKNFDGTVSSGTWQEFTFELDPDWQAGDLWSFDLKVAGSGPPVYLDVEYTLVGECIGCGGSVTFMYNGSEVTYRTVTSADDRCWLDRNLGASRVATTSTDQEAYGDYFTFDQAVNACPVDFRLATDAEWEAERQSWSSNNAAGAFASPLKLTMAGSRLTNGSLFFVGFVSRYWSGTEGVTNSFGANSGYLYLNSHAASVSSFGRAHGLSVRCLKN